LELEAILQPFSPQTTKSDLLGYMAANGSYVPSPFHEAFTKGKIFIADEFDAANPATAVVLNAAVANRRVTFPNLETIKAQPKFRVIFVMNTTGYGADHQYTGRMRQDAASLDRMVYLHVGIDPGLESALAGITIPLTNEKFSSGDRFEGGGEILAEIRKVRRSIEALKLNYLVSPRAVLHATAMHAGGFNREWIMNCCVWRGMPEIDKHSIKTHAGV
jgi:cobaltochelatase CobS